MIQYRKRVTTYVKGEKAMAIVKVNWSGGKDSTTAVLLHVERGDTVKVVCYIPMLTKQIPLLTRKHCDICFGSNL